MEIEKVIIDDFEDILAMYADMQNIHAEKEPDIFRSYHAESFTRERFLSDLENENIIYLKAKINDKNVYLKY